MNNMQNNKFDQELIGIFNRCFTKKELKNIYQFLKFIKKKIKIYQKYDIKVSDSDVLLIGQKANIKVQIGNYWGSIQQYNKSEEPERNSCEYEKPEDESFMEVSILITGKDSKNKLNKDDYLKFKSTNSQYGGLTIIDFEEFLTNFSSLIKNYGGI